jgi:UDP-glucose 4-epimerase
MLRRAMRCLVSGGAGFIGSNLVDALVARGDRVTVLDNLSSGRRENLAAALAGGAELVVGDVCDEDALRCAFAVARPEVVFHLAAQIDVRRSVADPGFDAATNVLGTIAMLEAARAAGARRFVNSSTGGGLYGDAELIPTPEEHPVRPLAPYGQAKHAAEGYCELYARLHGLSTISLRYGNVYGPRQDAHGEAGVVAIFCGHLLQRRPPVVYGDGGQTRDWVEVSDVVAANLLAADSTLGGAVNIGRGRETTVLQLLDYLRALSIEGDGELLPARFERERPGEVRRSCLEVSRARRELGWEAKVDLGEGLPRVLASLRGQPSSAASSPVEPLSHDGPRAHS